MAFTEHTLVVLLVILFSGLVLPDFLKRFKFPFFTSLIILGALMGPYVLDIVRLDETISFFGFLGSTFLLLLAGLEVKAEHFKNLGRKIIPMAFLTSLIPFSVGFSIARILEFTWLEAFAAGTLFVTSGVAIIVSSVKSARLSNKDLGKMIIAVVVLQDVISLFLLSLILQETSPITDFPLLIYFGILISSVIVLRMFIPEIAKFFFISKKHKAYEGKLRFVLVLLIAIVLYFNALGVHPIVAAFIAGILLADIIKSKRMHEKLHTLGHGIFVPVFFFIVGMELDISVLTTINLDNLIPVIFVLSAIASKFLSGFMAAKVAKFSTLESAIFGTSTTVQLTMALAAAFIFSSLKTINPVILTSIAIVAIITTTIAPLILSVLAKRVNKNA